jgi:hypothetical protein
MKRLQKGLYPVIVIAGMAAAAGGCGGSKRPDADADPDTKCRDDHPPWDRCRHRDYQR